MIIYEEEGCPKVEVVSIDGVPHDIVTHDARFKNSENFFEY